MHDLVTITVLTLPFVFVIAITAIQNSEKNKRRQLQADLYAKALENGHPLPSDLFMEAKKKRNPLNIGIICIAIGIGMSLFAWLVNIFESHTMTDEAAISFNLLELAGIIPFLIGVAFLIIHFIEKKNNNGENAK